jgi:hypothetical protein
LLIGSSGLPPCNKTPKFLVSQFVF